MIPDLPGYNPNEEHALKLESRFYALRDDLNVSNANGVVSSKPYVLIEYTRTPPTIDRACGPSVSCARRT